MYCTKCGAKIPEEATFCTKCGQKVKEKSNENQIEIKVPEEKQEQEQDQHSEQRTQQQAVHNGLHDDIDVVALVHQGDELQSGVLRLQFPEAACNVVGGFGSGVGTLLFKAQHDTVLAVELGVGLVMIVGDDNRGNIL